MSRFPAGAIVARVQITPAGAAPGSGSTAVVNAPSAGFRNRIWGCGAAHGDMTVATTDWYLPWESSGGDVGISQYLSAAANSVSDYFPGGLALAPNSNWRVVRRYRVANKTIDFWAIYTIEEI